MGYNYFDSEGNGERIFVPTNGDILVGSGGMVLEKASADISKIEDFGEKQLRSNAMSIVLSWVDEGDYSFSALDAFLIGMADLDEDGEIGDDEADVYNALMQAVADGFSSLGADGDQIQAFIDDEEDDSGEKLGNYLSSKLDESDLEDADLIGQFAVEEDFVMEAMKKVVRNGKVVLIRKPVKKKRLSAAQRMALKKARRRSNSAAARLSRKKAMKLRKQRNI